MHNLKIGIFDIDCSEYRFHSDMHSFIAKMDNSVMMDKFLPFLKENVDNELEFSIDGKSYLGLPGGIFFDKDGNFEFNFINKELKNSLESNDYDLAVMGNSVPFQNLLKVVTMQDSIIREIINHSSELESTDSVQEYLKEFPNPINLKHQVDNLTEWRNSKFGNDFMTDLD